jgi:hypothetical protein
MDPSWAALQDPPLLQGELLYDGDSLARPFDIGIVGQYLVVIDAHERASLHILESETGLYIGSFGEYGSGPMEITGVWSIDVWRELSWVYNLNQRRFIGYDLSVVQSGERPVATTSIHIESYGTLTDPRWISDSLILSPGLFNTGRLGFFNAKGELIREAGPLPPGPHITPVSVRQHAYQSSMAFNADRSKLVLATMHADRLEIFRSDGELVTIVTGPIGFEPIYEVASNIDGAPIMATDVELRFGYVGVDATDDYIYALYSGRVRGEYSGNASMGDQLHVFTWSGKPIHVFKLDRDASGIAVSTHGETLFIVSGINIVRYHLPILSPLATRANENIQ